MIELPHERERLVEAGPFAVQTSTAGSGPPLFMLNGLGASLEVLVPLRRALPDFRTLAFDPPGVGRSRAIDWPMRLPGHADAAVRVLDHAGWDKVDVFGVSWGGALAQELAHRHPDRVDRLVLTSTTPGPGLLVLPSTYLAFFDTRTRTSDEYIERVAPRLFGGRARDDARALLDTGIYRKLARKNSKSYLFQMAAAAGWSSLRYLWRLPQETLIVTGDDDPLVRPYNSTILNLLIRRSTLKVIPGEGHLLIVTAADRLASLIRDFLPPREELRLAA